MAKYIDADLLREEIEFAKSIYNNPQRVVHGVADAYRQDGRAAMCDDILKKIDSLQQEQRETDGDDGKFVEILVRKEFAEQIQRLGDEIHAGQSSFVGAMNQQEQPEVDLEVRKQIEELANDWHHKGFASDEDCPLCMQDLMDNLWHFYELGKNSK